MWVEDRTRIFPCEYLSGVVEIKQGETCRCFERSSKIDGDQQLVLNATSSRQRGPVDQNSSCGWLGRCAREEVRHGVDSRVSDNEEAEWFADEAGDRRY